MCLFAFSLTSAQNVILAGEHQVWQVGGRLKESQEVKLVIRRAAARVQVETLPLVPGTVSMIPSVKEDLMVNLCGDQAMTPVAARSSKTAELNRPVARSHDRPRATRSRCDGCSHPLAKCPKIASFTGTTPLNQEDGRLTK